MPLPPKRLSADRQNFDGSLTAADVASLADDPQLRVLQTSSSVDARTWLLLNENLFAVRADVELRVYGFYSSVCDLSFLRLVENVRHFSADCLMHAKGVEHLESLKNLRSLSIGIFDLDSFDFLRDLPTGQIQSLSLGQTQSKRPRIDVLQDFKALKTLYIEGQQNGIEAISSLANLEDLTLRSITAKELAFLRPLTRLRSLDIKLGGTRNITDLAGLDSIQYLELWQIKGFSDLSAISAMPGLQYLFLQSLRNVTAIPDLSKSIALRRIFLENMKGLKDFSAIATAPALEEFIHTSALGLAPEDYTQILAMKTLKKAGVWFGSDKKNQAFRALANKYGIEEYKHHPFSFSGG
jgi:hypothetical protein